MTWDAPVPIFEDENEDELIAKFVELSARYGDSFEPVAIAEEVFSGLRDPYPRSHQAAMRWSTKLEIKERIRKAKQTKDDEDLVKDRDDWEKRVLALSEDHTINFQEKKVRLDALNSIAKSRGWLDGEKDGGGGAAQLPQFIFQIDPRSKHNAA